MGMHAIAGGGRGGRGGRGGSRVSASWGGSPEHRFNLNPNELQAQGYPLGYPQGYVYGDSRTGLAWDVVKAFELPKILLESSYQVPSECSLHGLIIVVTHLLSDPALPSLYPAHNAGVPGPAQDALALIRTCELRIHIHISTAFAVATFPTHPSTHSINSLHPLTYPPTLPTHAAHPLHQHTPPTPHAVQRYAGLSR